MLQTLFGPIQYLYRVWTSSDALFLAPSLPPHILPLSPHSLFCFLPSFCSVSFLFSLVAHILFCLFLLSSFLHFLLFAPLPFILDFLISCALTTSPHFPSSDPSGPETPSFSALRPLPPPKVLTPQHTALCAASCSHPGPPEGPHCQSVSVTWWCHSCICIWGWGWVPSHRVPFLSVEGDV